MKFYAAPPLKYKRSVVSGFVYRIYNSCSTWGYFHDSLVAAKRIFDNNQYPTNFYEPIISDTINRILIQQDLGNPTTESNKEEQARESFGFPTIQRKTKRGLCTIFEETLCSLQGDPNLAKIENG